MAKIPYLEVIYEDDLENSNTHQATINRILDYLSMERREVTTRHRKVNTQSLKDFIVNYDEFVDSIRAQGWQEYL